MASMKAAPKKDESKKKNASSEGLSACPYELLGIDKFATDDEVLHAYNTHMKPPYVDLSHKCHHPN